LRVLVTGGSGFIGQRLVRRLEKHGHHVLNIDPVVGKSLFDSTDEMKAFDPHGVFHLAAYIDIVWCAEHRDETWKLNVEGTRRLLEMFDGENLEHFTFMSSAAVYGYASDEPMNEESELLPGNVYAQSKATGELLVEDFAVLNPDTKATVARLFNPLGGGSLDTQILPRMIQSIKSGEEITVANPNFKRDYIWVGDAVRAIMAASECGGTYNVGTGIGTSISDLALYLSRASGDGVHIRIDASRERPDDGHIVSDPGRLLEIGWKPKVTVEEAVARIWEESK
jgi:nucleoside-diphosphate-sugar epimerase